MDIPKKGVQQHPFRRSAVDGAEAMLEAIIGRSRGERTPTEEDVVLTVCYQGDACDACRSTGGYESGASEGGTLRFTVAQARERSVLPHTGCQHTVNGVPGFCRCRYKAV